MTSHEPARALLLSGPPGSGKTTVARTLASRYPRAVHLETDAFWHFIASGHIEAWRPESNEQNALVMRIVADVARRYAAAGYFTIVDGIIGPRWFFKQVRDDLARGGTPVSYVILRPRLEVAIARAAARTASPVADARVIERLWKGFADLDAAFESHVIDDSDLTPEATAAAVHERLESGRLVV